MSASSKYTYDFGPPKNVLKKNIFVSLSGRQTDRHTERLILYQLIHSLIDHKGWDWVWLGQNQNPGATSGFPRCVKGNQVFQLLVFSQTP